MRLPIVFTDEDGKHMILLPDGTELQGVVFTRVYDGTNEAPHVIIKAWCQISGNRDDALKLLNEQ
jgi:hypothetical protein